MLGELKFKLLGWLLSDICTKAGGDNTCDNCYLQPFDKDDVFCVCGRTEVFRQAVKSWKLKDRYESWNVREDL